VPPGAPLGPNAGRVIKAGLLRRQAPNATHSAAVQSHFAAIPGPTWITRRTSRHDHAEGRCLGGHGEAAAFQSYRCAIDLSSDKGAVSRAAAGLCSLEACRTVSPSCSSSNQRIAVKSAADREDITQGGCESNQTSPLTISVHVPEALSHSRLRVARNEKLSWRAGQLIGCCCSRRLGVTA
jgi:hypothetical protein